MVIEIRPREMVILAADFRLLVTWYQDVLGFEVTNLFEDGFHFCNLKTLSGIKIGIGSAAEMGVEPTDRSMNTVVLQFEVDDLAEFFAHVGAAGGSVSSGPSFDKKGGFWFGGIADPEGNPIWVVDKNCP